MGLDAQNWCLTHQVNGCWVCSGMDKQEPGLVIKSRRDMRRQTQGIDSWWLCPVEGRAAEELLWHCLEPRRRGESNLLVLPFILSQCLPLTTTCQQPNDFSVSSESQSSHAADQGRGGWKTEMGAHTQALSVGWINTIHLPLELQPVMINKPQFIKHSFKRGSEWTDFCDFIWKELPLGCWPLMEFLNRPWKGTFLLKNQHVVLCNLETLRKIIWLHGNFKLFSGQRSLFSWSQEP